MASETRTLDEQDGSWEEREAQTKARSIAEHSYEVGLAQRLVGHLKQGFHQTSPFTVPSRNEGIMFLVAVKASNSLRCAIDLTLKGYYVQAQTLARSA